MKIGLCQACFAVAIIVTSSSIAAAQSQRCENLTESTVFLLLVALLGVLLLTIVVLCVMVLRLRNIGQAESVGKKRRPTIRQTESNKDDDEVISGGAVKESPTKAVQKKPTTGYGARAASTDSTYASAEEPTRESTYAQPDHPNAVTNQKKTETGPDQMAAFKYDLAKSMASKETEKRSSEPKPKYPYSKVNKNPKAPKMEENVTAGSTPQPEMTIIDGNVYSPLTEGEYDHLHKKRNKIDDDPKIDNYQNIKMSNETKEKARTLDRKMFEAHYATPPRRSQTLKAYPRTATTNDVQETYDVPLKPTPIKRGNKFGGSMTSLTSSSKLIIEETYDVPPSADETYRIPPKQNQVQQQNLDTQECYDVPPSVNDIYRIPPSSRPLTGTEEVYAMPDADITGTEDAPNAHSTLKKENLYDKPPLIPTPFQQMYNVPKSNQPAKQRIVGGLVYEDV